MLVAHNSGYCTFSERNIRNLIRNCLDIVPVSNINVDRLSNTNRWQWFLCAILLCLVCANCNRFLHHRMNRTGYTDMVSTASTTEPLQHQAAVDFFPFLIGLSLSLSLSLSVYPFLSLIQILWSGKSFAFSVLCQYIWFYLSLFVAVYCFTIDFHNFNRLW